MKKRGLLLALVLAVLLAGCRKQEPEPVSPPEPPPEQPPVEEVVDTGLQMDSLRLELSRGNAGTNRLAEAVNTLPGLLEESFAQAEEVQIGQIRVTVGSSPAATIQSLKAGNIDLAFLPAEDYLRDGQGLTALYADADLSGSTAHVGTQALLCSAPTAHGQKLAERAGSGKPLSWKEISYARWGVLEKTSLSSYRALDLWLADNYEGAGVAELPKVTVYESEDALLRAAAAGEIDALVIRDDLRSGYADIWTLPAEEEGFGRTERIWEEVTVLDVSERLCGVVLAAAPNETMEDARFTKALAAAMERLSGEQELAAVLGAEGFLPVEEQQLDATARLVALEE